MAPLKYVIILAALGLAGPARAESVQSWQAYIDEASQRFAIPAAWIERVMRAESGGQTFRNGRPIRSSAGAMGLMQLMPKTWAEMSSRLRLGNNPDDPRDNILAGAFYLRLMLDRFGYPGLFAAYNAGPARYAAYLAGRGSLPGETAAYLSKVTSHRSAEDIYVVKQSRTGSLFALRNGIATSDPRTAEAERERPSSGMFAIDYPPGSRPWSR